MEQERIAFGTVLFGGFDKEAVYRYIEQLVAEFESKQKEFDRAKKGLETEKVAAQERVAQLEAEVDALRAEKEALEVKLAKAQEETAEE